MVVVGTEAPNIEYRIDGNECALQTLQDIVRTVRDRPTGIMLPFEARHIQDKQAMEAERVNAISNLLTDLDRRAAELRRYL